ncbi:MAG: hypothetical protein ACI857_002419 [Arenicella sp.]|jgi:hypothetical protein
MTVDEKNFISTHISKPWSVQHLFLTKDINSYCPFGLEEIPFRDVGEILDFGDIPFCISLNDYSVYSYLPISVSLVLTEVNKILNEESDYYITAVTIPNVKVSSMVNIPPDSLLNHSIHQFQSMVRNIKNYISLQLKPEFSQVMLDAILDELKDKPFEELSSLKQNQLKHFSTYLNNFL